MSSRKLHDRIFRFPWDCQDSGHAWGGASDAMLYEKMFSLSGINRECLKPLAGNTSMFSHAVVPNLIMLNNSKAPSLAPRNFWKVSHFNPTLSRPTDILGPQLTKEEQQTLMRLYEIDKPYHFVYHLASSTQDAARLASYIIGISTLTSYSLGMSISLGELYATALDNYQATTIVDSYESCFRTPMLVIHSLWEVPNQYNSFVKGFGVLGSLFYERFHKGRTTVLIDDRTLANIAHLETSKIDERNIYNASQECPFMKTSLQKYVFDPSTRINCSLDEKLNPEVWHVRR